MGCIITEKKTAFFKSKTTRSVDIVRTNHIPVSTDMQAQMMALLTIASGTSIITETVFESDISMQKTMRMGADITLGDVLPSLKV